MKLKVGDKVRFKKNCVNKISFGMDVERNRAEIKSGYMVTDIKQYVDIQGHGTMSIITEDMVDRLNKFRVGDTVYYRGKKKTITRYENRNSHPYTLSNGLSVEEFEISEKPKFKDGDTVKLRVGERVRFRSDMTVDISLGWSRDMEYELAGADFTITEVHNGYIMGHGTHWTVRWDMLERFNKFRVGKTVYWHGDEVTVMRYDGQEILPYQLSNGLWVDEEDISDYKQEERK